MHFVEADYLVSNVQFFLNFLFCTQHMSPLDKFVAIMAAAVHATETDCA